MASCSLFSILMPLNDSDSTHPTLSGSWSPGLLRIKDWLELRRHRLSPCAPSNLPLQSTQPTSVIIIKPYLFPGISSLVNILPSCYGHISGFQAGRSVWCPKNNGSLVSASCSVCQYLLRAGYTFNQGSKVCYWKWTIRLFFFIIISAAKLMRKQHL